jgi:hypothetical protein
MKNIIAEHIDTPLIIQVENINDISFSGKVLVPDENNHVGKVYSWLRKSFNISNKETKTDLIVQYVVDKFQERSKIGIEKYKTTQIGRAHV